MERGELRNLKRASSDPFFPFGRISIFIRTILVIQETFLKCSQMSGVFYHSLIHGLGFFIGFVI